MKFFKKKGVCEIYAPVNGGCISLEEVADEVFSSRMMGDGVAFQMDDDVVCSPMDGVITMIATTSHAFGITSNSGVEVLVHVGLDTVQLNGEGIEVLGNVDAEVKKGDPILKIDREFMASKRIDLTIPMIFLNGDVYTVELQPNTSKVVKGDTLIARISK